MALEAFHINRLESDPENKGLKSDAGKPIATSKKLNPKNEGFVPKEPPKLEEIVPIPVQDSPSPSVWVDELIHVPTGNLFN